METNWDAVLGDDSIDFSAYLTGNLVLYIFILLIFSQEKLFFQRSKRSHWGRSYIYLNPRVSSQFCTEENLESSLKYLNSNLHAFGVISQELLLPSSELDRFVPVI